MALTRRRPLYVVDPGVVVGRRGGRLVVTRDGVMVTSAPLAMLSEVVVFGTTPVTMPAMTALLGENVPLVLLTADGRVRGRLEPPSATQVELRRRQLERHADPADRLAVARAIVGGKIHNQDVLLRRRAGRSHNPDEVWALARRLADLRGRTAQASSVEQLVGIEGAASGAYFQGIRIILPPDSMFQRRERTEPDVVNVLINYCSALLREVVFGAVVAAGLDPYVSFLHTPRPGRPTLVFDLMEEWRPILLESTVLALLGLRAVRPDHLGRPSRNGGPGPSRLLWSAAFAAESSPDDDEWDRDAPAWPGATAEGRERREAASDQEEQDEESVAVDADVSQGVTTARRLASEATAAAVARFRARMSSPARGWPDPGGRSYGAQLRAQAVCLRNWVRHDESYVPFAWR